MIGLLVLNTPVALYTSVVHQRGTVAVMRYLDREAQEGHVTSVLLLMPCHSTPLYSHFHHNISIKHLDCSPSSEPNYIEEADYVFSNPLRWLKERYSEEKLLPSHLVMYDPMAKHIQAFINYHNYSETAVFFHSHFPEERIGRSVIVYGNMARNH
jgi:phosphatidylinositol glycan class B